MIDLPRISIVTPCYNMDQFLERTIQSVLSQNYPNLEYIIMDGGSTDGSIEIIKKYQNQLTYWESRKDNGMYDALNKGFEKATGEIMTYINADDILCVGSLFTVAQIFSDFSEVRWLTGMINIIDEENRCVHVDKIHRWNRIRYYTKDYEWIQQEGTFWRKSLWDEAGGYISTFYKLASDLELWSRYFQCSDLHVIQTTLGSFRFRNSNQKSLEQFDSYLSEASTILDSLKISEEDLSIISQYKKFRVEKLMQIPLVKRLSFLQNINKKFNAFPPVLRYERKSKKFQF